MEIACPQKRLDVRAVADSVVAVEVRKRTGRELTASNQGAMRLRSLLDWQMH